MTAGGIRTRFWIDMGLECVRRDHTPDLSPGDQKGPFLTARALGMALGALNDVKAFATGTPSLLGLPAPAALAALVGSDQVDIAAAAACHQVFRLRYPNQASMLEPAWLNWLDYFGLGSPGQSRRQGELQPHLRHAGWSHPRRGSDRHRLGV
jgi:vanadium chloroperoxidase